MMRAQVTFSFAVGLGCLAMLVACGDSGPAGAGDAGDTRDVSRDVGACGNGVVDPGEACDDGNAVSGDGCTPDCTDEGASICTPCSDDDECGVEGDWCVPLVGGLFCAQGCADEPCPTGYSCEAIERDDGRIAGQCIPDRGACGGCPDADGDQVCDVDDQCPGVVDGGDSDSDGVPDGCDVCAAGDDGMDRDGDLTPDACDGCPDVANRTSPPCEDTGPCTMADPDSDGDGVCDSIDTCPGAPDSADADGDGVCDSLDVCPGSPDGTDSDLDGVPDGCDVCGTGDDNNDRDSDGTPDTCDGCPDAGDRTAPPCTDAACPTEDPDTDGDGVCDSEDICEDGPDTPDTDGDGAPDACDECPNASPDDADDDGVCDDVDICPEGDDTADEDEDGVPDDCDPCPTKEGVDEDDDGVCDLDDICPEGDDNIDTDDDGVPDACDPCDGPGGDSDDDGVCDDEDLCPGGPDDVDADGDGTPDACEVMTPGSYQYDRIDIAGLEVVETVDFHPDGSYFVFAERTNRVYAWDVESNTGAVADLDPSGSGNIYWNEVEFAPDGSYALLVGYDTSDGTVGVVHRFDDSVWRELEGTDLSSAITELSPPVDEVYEAVEFPPDGGDPWVLSRTASSSYIVRLREMNPTTGDAEFLFASASGAGCQDMAFIDNGLGHRGLVVVCGINGFDSFYFTQERGLGGDLEWVVRTGSEIRPGGTLGNTSRIASHPTLQYGLAISWSGDRVYRFQDDFWGASADTPWFTRRRLWGLTFQQTGERALIFGRQMNVSGSNFAVVLEYRHDEYDCSSPLTPSCDLTEVSIPNFGSPPFSAPDSTNLNGGSWRPGCDGGVLVGGYSNFSTNYGVVATFQLEGGEDCW